MDRLRQIFLDDLTKELVILKENTSNYQLSHFYQTELTDSITLLHSKNTDKILVEALTHQGTPIDNIEILDLNTIRINFASQISGIINIFTFE